MTELTLKKRLFTNYYLSKWCKYEAHCDRNEVEHNLMLWLAKFAFFSWLPDLPEDDFGTTLADYMNAFAGDRGKEGFNTFVTTTLGDDWLRQFSIKDDDIYRPHPFHLMRLFVSNYANTHRWAYHNSMPRNVSKMAKLLMYPSFAASYAKQKDISVIDTVKQELNKYPYKTKDNFSVSSPFSFLTHVKRALKINLGPKFQQVCA